MCLQDDVRETEEVLGESDLLGVLKFDLVGMSSGSVSLMVRRSVKGVTKSPKQWIRVTYGAHRSVKGVTKSPMGIGCHLCASVGERCHTWGRRRDHKKAKTRRQDNIRLRRERPHRTRGYDEGGTEVGVEYPGERRRATNRPKNAGKDTYVSIKSGHIGHAGTMKVIRKKA